MRVFLLLILSVVIGEPAVAYEGSPYGRYYRDDRGMGPPRGHEREYTCCRFVCLQWAYDRYGRHCVNGQNLCNQPCGRNM